MRIAKWILAAAVAATALGGTEQPKVQLCMTTSVQNSSYIEWSKKIATEIFNEAGVSLEWAARKACRPDAIRIRIQDNTAPETHPHAYAYAMPYEGHTIVVLYDRVEKENKGAALAYVLAHVLAHEIGHILEGVARHSDSGTLKAAFTPVDRAAMVNHHIGFAPEDVHLIHAGIADRAKTGI